MGKRHHWGRGANAIAALAALSLATSTLLAQPAPAKAPPAPAPAEAPAAPPADGPSEELRADAAARKKAGDEAMDTFRFADALAAYSDAYAITKNTALL
ncbi:MAG TPA: hypothetical protein VK459_20835, partial [Polyangiaceae bacterium]|nr:hypothetical protein [Polyangiaceae bacterium]